MEKISVALAGPWWTNLTYLAPERLPEGARVRVPVGKGARVAVVVGPGEDGYEGELREIASVIDSTPILPSFAMPLVRWFSETYLCGLGTAMKTLLPANFLKGEFFDESPDTAALDEDGPDSAKSPPLDPTDLFIYEPVDALRLERYVELCSDGRPTLICFPLYESARDFAKLIENATGTAVTLCPRSGARAEWRAWGDLSAPRGKSVKMLVGGQAAATAPLQGLSRIIVEDESNNAWRTVRPPLFNMRSLLSKRARIERASIVLGGRMPSSRVFMMRGADLTEFADRAKRPEGTPKSRKNFFFVDLKLAYSPSVKGVRDALAVSEPLVRESEAAIRRGSWVLWILDRKGYAGEIVCDECGVSLRCPRCGGAMRWEASAARLVCVACGTSGSIPECCPSCSGRLLMARRPGLEALLPLAKSAINSPVPILPMDAAAIEAAPGSPSGLMVGTRAALALCDSVTVGMVGWIDADGEARSQEYDARARAFGLVWESRWRGRLPDERRVVLQTRRAGRDWQRGLDQDVRDRPAWSVFWRTELKERREFSMPPFTPLVKIETRASEARAMVAKFDDARFEYWLSDPSGEQDSPGSQASPKTPSRGSETTIWLRTKRLGDLRSALSPFFSIKRVRTGCPSITIRYE